MDNNHKLRELQLCELDILTELIRICEKYAIRYYLVGGTLLGAVRHEGFIPWDDDIDIAMMRADYERFVQICSDELNPDYFLQTPDTDPHYFLTYAKLRKNGTEIYEDRFRGARFHKGIFIDIFPLDFCPKPGLISHFFFNVLAVMNYRGQIDSGESYVPYREISGKLGYFLLRLFSAKGIVRLRKTIIQCAGKWGGEEYLASYSGAYGYRKEICRLDWYEPCAVVRFEGRSCCVPGEFKRYLQQIYGTDYMQLPAPDQRKAHIDLNTIHFSFDTNSVDESPK